MIFVAMRRSIRGFIASRSTRRIRYSRFARLFRDQADETPLPLNALDTPEDLAYTEELCGAVNAAIEALPERTAIGLYELRGLSYAQVAAATSCPVGTVRSRVFRAREAIENRLQRIFDDGPGEARHRSRAFARRALLPSIARTVDPP